MIAVDLYQGADVPPLSPAGKGEIYFDSATNKFRVSENGGAFANLLFTIAAVGATGTANANGMVLTNGVLNLTPATNAFPGVISTTTQNFLGAKTFQTSVQSPAFRSSTANVATGGFIRSAVGDTWFALASDLATNVSLLKLAALDVVQIGDATHSVSAPGGLGTVGNITAATFSGTSEALTSFLSLGASPATAGALRFSSGFQAFGKPTSGADRLLFGLDASDRFNICGDLNATTGTSDVTVNSFNHTLRCKGASAEFDLTDIAVRHQNTTLYMNFNANGVTLQNVGSGFHIKEGTNATMGTGILVGGAATVATTKVTATSRIWVGMQLLGGTQGALGSPSRNAGTDFAVASTNPLDTSTFAWVIWEPS